MASPVSTPRVRITCRGVQTSVSGDKNPMLTSTYPDLSECRVVLVREDGTEEEIPDVSKVTWTADPNNLARAVIEVLGPEIDVEGVPEIQKLLDEGYVGYAVAEPELTTKLRELCHGMDMIGSGNEKRRSEIIMEMRRTVEKLEHPLMGIEVRHPGAGELESDD